MGELASAASRDDQEPSGLEPSGRGRRGRPAAAPDGLRRVGSVALSEHQKRTGAQNQRELGEPPWNRARAARALRTAKLDLDVVGVPQDDESIARSAIRQTQLLEAIFLGVQLVWGRH